MSKIKPESIYETLREMVLDDPKQRVKGKRGKVAVVGGSIDYTGAPFFAAISAIAASCELVFVYCHPAAAVPIKAYSPDLIVIPLPDPAVDTSDLVMRICRADCVIVGPGAGQSDSMQRIMEEVIKETSKQSVAVVVDADGLRLPRSQLEAIRNHPCALLTPNMGELEILEKTLGGNLTGRWIENPEFLGDEEDVVFPKDVLQKAAAISSYLNVTILTKSPVDMLVDNKRAIVVGHHGSTHRCGGLGDVLSGVCGAVCAFRQACVKRRASADENINVPSIILLAAIAAYTVRSTAAQTESQVRGYIRATDVIEQLGATIRKALRE